MTACHSQSVPANMAWTPGSPPTYPLTMRMVHALIPVLDMIVVGILVTAAAGLGAAVLLYRWACRRTDEVRQHAGRPVAVLRCGIVGGHCRK